jgi:hypothetical protein
MQTLAIKMETHKITYEDGNLFAFEISSTWCSRRKAVSIIERLNNVEITKRPKWFSFKGQDVFCEFNYKDISYLIEEPWGDSSRYWIGPEEKSGNSGINEILECFNNA